MKIHRHVILHLQPHSEPTRFTDSPRIPETQWLSCSTGAPHNMSLQTTAKVLTGGFQTERSRIIDQDPSGNRIAA